MKYLNIISIKRKLKGLIFSLLASLTAGNAYAVCEGKMVNPITDVNWNYMIPVTVAGVKAGDGKNVLLHREPASLKCPHQAFPGVGMTFFSPDLLIEVVSEPMCSVSLPKAKFSKMFDQNRGDNEQDSGDGGAGDGGDGGDQAYKHVHSFNFAILSSLELFSTLAGCLDATAAVGDVTNGMAGGLFGVKYLSEFDPTHANPLWSVVFAPETIIFAIPPVQLTCIPDTISASFGGQPLTPLFWCQGQRGVVYPFGGWASSGAGVTMDNIDVAEKELARGSRTLIYPSTIGPWAQCMTIPLGIITKSQYSFDPTFPVKRTSGKKIMYGELVENWSLGRPANTPDPRNGSDSAYVVWRARQCSVGK